MRVQRKIDGLLQKGNLARRFDLAQRVNLLPDVLQLGLRREQWCGHAGTFWRAFPPWRAIRRMVSRWGSRCAPRCPDRTATSARRSISLSRDLWREETKHRYRHLHRHWLRQPPALRQAK